DAGAQGIKMSGSPTLHFRAREHLFCVRNCLGCPNMKPQSVKPLAVEASPFCRRENERCQGKNLDRSAGKKPGLDDPDTRIDKRRNLALRPLGQPPIWTKMKVARRVDTNARCERCDKQQNVHLIRIPGAREAAQI